jgi:uncharacterized protein YozE (UPF0346 family)
VWRNEIERFFTINAENTYEKSKYPKNERTIHILNVYLTLANTRLLMAILELVWVNLLSKVLIFCLVGRGIGS